MDLLQISQKIRAIRQSQKMTVEQLAAKSGFSKGFISQVENFRLTPSLKALDKIAAALGLSMGTLFQDSGPSPEYSFGHLDEGEEVIRDDNLHFGIRYFALAYRQIGRQINPFIVEYTPAAEERDFMMHDTEEFFLLLDGELEYSLFDRNNTRIMHQGDTLYMKANIPHQVRLHGDCSFARALIVYSPPQTGIS